MSSRARRFATLVCLVILAACGSPMSGVATPGGSVSGAPSAGATSSASSSPSASPSPIPPASPEPLRIGLVAPIPSAEHTARDAATAQAVSNAAAELDVEHEIIQTEEDADYEPNIQAFVEHDFGIVVTVGGAVGPATIAAARAAPDTWFIGVDQRACVTAAGDPDPDARCEGDPAVLIPNYQALSFAGEQGAYLAGIVAGTVSDTGIVAVVAGAGVPWVVRSWRAFENGARSVDPDVEVRFVQLAADPSGFGDPALGLQAGDQVVRDGADVVLQVAGDSGTGVLEAACAGGIAAVGSIVDQARAFPERRCIVTSAETRYGEVVAAAIERAASGELHPGNLTNGIGSDPPGAGLSPITGGVDLSSDAAVLLGSASRALGIGTLDPCAPVACTVSGAPEG